MTLVFNASPLIVLAKAGLLLTGTLGLILRAKRSGIIPSVTPCLEAVASAGLFITPTHLDLIRKQAGESS